MRFREGEKPGLKLNIPFASAIMQSVSDHEMAHRPCAHGGIAFIFVSQPIATQAEMVDKVKRFKAGFVASDSNIRPEATLRDVIVTAGAQRPYHHGRDRRRHGYREAPGHAHQPRLSSIHDITRTLA